MTREQAIAELKECERIGEHDSEAAHVKADMVLVKLLTDLGYSDVVGAWSEVDKWYA